jgi:hypothetical protein
MVLLLRDLQDSVIVPFSSEASIANSISMSFVVSSLLADMLAIYALVKQQDIPPDTLFILSLIFADLFFGGTALVLTVANHIYSGWALGRTGKKCHN